MTEYNGLERRHILDVKVDALKQVVDSELTALREVVDTKVEAVRQHQIQYHNTIVDTKQDVNDIRRHIDNLKASTDKRLDGIEKKIVEYHTKLAIIVGGSGLVVAAVVSGLINWLIAKF